MASLLEGVAVRLVLAKSLLQVHLPALLLVAPPALTQMVLEQILLIAARVPRVLPLVLLVARIVQGNR